MITSGRRSPAFAGSAAIGSTRGSLAAVVLGRLEPFLVASSPESVDQMGSAVLLNEQPANNRAIATTPGCARPIYMRTGTSSRPGVNGTGCEGFKISKVRER